MDKEIIKLHKEQNQTKLQEVVLSQTDGQLSQLISHRAVKGRGDTCALLKAIFSGLPCSVAAAVKLRLALFKQCIELLQNSELQSKTASEMLGILMMEVDEFSSTSLAELANTFVDNVKNGIGSSKSLELFPKILWAIEMKETVSFGGREMKGVDYKSHVLNSLCSGRWDSGIVIHLAAMFKDVPVTQEELRFVLIKILRMLKELDLQELPPLIYQILLLSAKGHKKLVLEGIVRYFVDQDSKLKQKMLQQKDDILQVTTVADDQLSLIEGTIILHITFAVKLDQELGREFVKFLKADQQNSKSVTLAPFCVALALSLSRIHRFEEQICDFLKAGILKVYKDHDKQSQSAWTREVVPAAPDVAAWLMDTVQHSVHGWDHVTQGLVQLGFMLMDAFGPKAAFGRITETSGHVISTPTQKACRLGADILLETFKVHKIVRAEILEQILNRVVTKATAPVSHYLDLLAQTVQSAPQILLDSLPKVREAFDYLSFLPPPTAQALLKSVQPLLKISMTLKDSLLLVLRKAMFSKQVDARKTAVNGFLMILKHFRVLGGMPFSQASQSLASSSQRALSPLLPQIQVDIHIPHNPASNEGLCLEILGNLRRCLTQQAQVRMTLYAGLHDVLCRNTQLGYTILGTLYQQLFQYYEPQDNVGGPLQLERCIVMQADEVYTAEPLAHLLACLVHCYLKTREIDADKLGDDEEEDENHVQSDVQELLQSLTNRMAQCELQDFELDKSANFSMGTSVGVKNNIYALLVSGAYEVLMEFAFQTSDFKVAGCETVERLFQKHQQITEILSEKSQGGGGGAGGKKGAKGNPGKAGTSSGSSSSTATSKQKSLLSVGFLCTLVKALYSDTHPHHQAGLTVLRDNRDFQRHVLSLTQQKISQVNSSGSCDGPEGHDTQRLFTYCCSIARVLQKYYHEELQTTGEDVTERRKSVNLLAVEILTTTFNIAFSRYEDQLHDFLAAVDISRPSAGGDCELEVQDLIFKMIKKYQRAVMTVITNDGDRHSAKEAVSLLSIIHLLTQHIGMEGERGTLIITWIQKICTEQVIDDLALTKVLVSELLQLTTQRHSCATVIRDLARDIHSQVGDIDQAVEVDETSSMAIVNHRTAAPPILLLVTAHMDRELDDTDWVINRLKGGLAGTTDLIDDQDPDSPGLTQLESQEKSICLRLGHMVNALHELCQSAIQQGPCVDAMLKVTTRIFNSLSLLTKYNLQMYQQKSGSMSRRFEKLVKLSGVNLTQWVYAMITYVQTIQNEALQQQTNDKGKKDKKKQEQSGKARVMKETKAIPNLIFSIEQYEKFLIQLSKKSKVNLMDHFKMSTARDFRINVASLENALAEQSDDEEDNDVTQDQSVADQENDKPAEASRVQDTSLAKRKSSPVNVVPKKKSKLGSRNPKV